MPVTKKSPAGAARTKRAAKTPTKKTVAEAAPPPKAKVSVAKKTLLQGITAAAKNILKPKSQKPAAPETEVTAETLVRDSMVVIKRDSRQEPFDREKLLRAVRAACHKRPVDNEQITMLIEDVIDAVEALYEAADEDSATGGPDLIRGIYPLVATVTARGFESVPEEEVAERFASLIERRRSEGRQP